MMIDLLAVAANTSKAIWVPSLVWRHPRSNSVVYNHVTSNVSAKQVLVTRGAGFLGSYLCDLLIAEGHDVICLDNFFTGTKRTIEHLIGHLRFELLRHHVTFPLYIEVDEIYNLACPASPVHYQPRADDEDQCAWCDQHAGVGEAFEVQDLLGFNQRSLQRPCHSPQTEDYWGNVNPMGPRSCYDEGNRCAEALFFDYCRQHKLEIKVCAPSTRTAHACTPMMGVWYRLHRAGFEDQPITRYGDGNQTRSSCYVDDLIDGFVRFMKSPKDVTGPINLGNPGEFTMKQLAELPIELTGSKSKLTYLPLPQDDPKQRQPDITPGSQALRTGTDRPPWRRRSPTSMNYSRLAKGQCLEKRLRDGRACWCLRWSAVLALARQSVLSGVPDNTWFVSLTAVMVAFGRPGLRGEAHTPGRSRGLARPILPTGAQSHRDGATGGVLLRVAHTADPRRNARIAPRGCRTAGGCLAPRARAQFWRVVRRHTVLPSPLAGSCMLHDFARMCRGERYSVCSVAKPLFFSLPSGRYQI